MHLCFTAGGSIILLHVAVRVCYSRLSLLANVEPLLANAAIAEGRGAKVGSRAQNVEGATTPSRADSCAQDVLGRASNVMLRQVLILIP